MATAASDRPSAPVAETSCLPAAHEETCGTSARRPASARRCNCTCGGKSSTRDANVGTTTTLKRRFRRAAAGRVPQRIAENAFTKEGGKGRSSARNGSKRCDRLWRRAKRNLHLTKVSSSAVDARVRSMWRGAGSLRPSPNDIDIFSSSFRRRSLPLPDEDHPIPFRQILCVHRAAFVPGFAKKLLVGTRHNFATLSAHRKRRDGVTSRGFGRIRRPWRRARRTCAWKRTAEVPQPQQEPVRGCTCSSETCSLAR